MLFLLMTLAVVSAEMNSIVGHKSAYLFEDTDCDEDVETSWLPNDDIRRSWGVSPTGSGKWGYSANVPPYSPPYQKTGHPSDVFDGDAESGYVWKTVSLLGENCPADSTNCKILTIGGDEVAAYNQGSEGRRCYNCHGVSSCANPEMTAHPMCSTAICDYCEGLSASMVFDTESPALIKEVSVTVQNERRSPRSIKVFYSPESVVGPFYEFASHTMASLQPGEVSFGAADGKGRVARYWKIEVTSNWGDPDHVELLEFKFFGAILKKPVSAKWVKEDSNCETAPLSTTTLDFGFASGANTRRQLENGQFKLLVNQATLGPYTVKLTAEELRKALLEAGFATTVTKSPLVYGNKYGEAFHVEFFTPADVTLVTRKTPLVTGLNLFPDDVYTQYRYVPAAKPQAFCVERNKAVVLSTFASIPESTRASLCVNGTLTANKETVYGITGVTPVYGPRGGVMTLTMTGNLEGETSVTMTDATVSDSVDCLSALPVPGMAAFDVADMSARVALSADSPVEGARFCVRYSNGKTLVAPSVTFDIEEAAVEAVVTGACSSVLMGATEVSLRGSGLSVGDRVTFTTGDCSNAGITGGEGVVNAVENGEAKVATSFSRVGTYHVMAEFSGMCRSFNDVTVTVYDFHAVDSFLFSEERMLVEITGSGFNRQDAIEFRKGEETLAMSASISQVRLDRIVFDVTVHAPAVEGEYTLFYKLSGCEASLALPEVFTFHAVSSVKTRVGESEIPFVTAVINKQEVIALTGLSFHEGDRAFYKNEAGDEAAVNLEVSSATEAQGKVTFTANGVYTLYYVFQGTRATAVGFPVSIATIDRVRVPFTAEGEEPLVVKGMTTLLTYEGHGIHDVERENAYKLLTPNPQLTGSNAAADVKYYNHRAVASHAPFVTVDDLSNPMDAVYAFDNGGRSTELNHFIIYDMKEVTTMHAFGMYVNSVFFQQLPRDFELQALVSCYEDDCLFGESGAKAEAPWMTVLSVRDLPKSNSLAGEFITLPLDFDATARYFRLFVTKNWGNTVFTSIIQVSFEGAKASNNDMNGAQWVDAGAECAADAFWRVQSIGHTTIDAFATSGLKELCYDFSSPVTAVEPMKMSDKHMRVAEVTGLSPRAVASHVNTAMEVSAVYGSAGDRIKFARPGATKDSDCWEATSMAFGSVPDKQTVTLTFDDVTHRGSFILALDGEKTVPIFVDDTKAEVEIKLEQLSSIDRASVEVQHSGKYTVKYTVTVLEPAGAKPLFQLILP